MPNTEPVVFGKALDKTPSTKNWDRDQNQPTTASGSCKTPWKCIVPQSELNTRLANRFANTIEPHVRGEHTLFAVVTITCSLSIVVRLQFYLR